MSQSHGESVLNVKMCVVYVYLCVSRIVNCHLQLQIQSTSAPATLTLSGCDDVGSPRRPRMEKGSEGGGSPFSQLLVQYLVLVH